MYTARGTRMPERTQIGPEVDKKLWKRFRENIKERKGTVRGNLGQELENAIREYISGDPDTPSRRIDARLARIEDELGISATDGGGEGAHTSDADPHTHARRAVYTTDLDKPAPNTSTDKKIDYLEQCIVERTDIRPDMPGLLPRSMIVEIVRDEYGFRRDTAKRYVEQLIERFGLRDHPKSGYDTLVTQPKYDDLIAEMREQAGDEADKLLSQLEDA